jgi:hypothetical protein
MCLASLLVEQVQSLKKVISPQMHPELLDLHDRIRFIFYQRRLTTSLISFLETFFFFANKFV